MEHDTAAFDTAAIATIRGLAMDAPFAANSGHVGTAMALAPLGHLLFSKILRHDPSDPTWPDRDRFVLSAGHASILLYSLLHLSGYDLSLDDLKAFRQLGSKTPGHPEFGHTPGVEITTGPLGQGLASAVGMAIGEARLRARFSDQLVDHYTYVIAGDGCLEEGISHEAASLAGHLGLGRLICFYDDNRITIDGATTLAMTDNAALRFSAYGWHVIEVGDAGEDLQALADAVEMAKGVSDQPSVIILRSHIGFPQARLVDTKEAHGMALTSEDIAATRGLLGLASGESFTVDPHVLEGYQQCLEVARDAHVAWQARLDASKDRDDFLEMMTTTPTADVAALVSFETGAAVATRNALKKVLNAAVPVFPQLLAGSADLTENTGVALEGAHVITLDDPGGNQLYFGIREHAMGAIGNGLALHGGTVPVLGTFFVFSDYLRPALRLAALSGLKVIYSFTHDSIGVGEDGPTHQPIEHLASLRAMPGLAVVRPADANETAFAFARALKVDGPVALILSRQNLSVLDGASRDGVEKGAYVISSASRDANVILVATGSEVALCLSAQQHLEAAGTPTSVVSMPSMEWFSAQPASYQQRVFPPNVAVVSVEAGSTFGWDRYADRCVGIDRFGLSAPAADVFSALSITVDAVVAAATNLLGTHGQKEQQ